MDRWIPAFLLNFFSTALASGNAPIFSDPSHCDRFYKELSEGRFSTRFTYLDEGARLWEAATEASRGFVTQEPEVVLLRSLLPDLVTQKPYRDGFNFVDIGPGSGDKAATLISLLPGAGRPHYLGVEFSDEMAKLARKRIEAASLGISVETLIADVESRAFRSSVIQLEKRTGRPSIFFLLGQTLGNSADIPRFLKSTRDSMSPDSTLVVGVDLFDPAKVTDLVKQYSDPSYVDMDLWILKKLGLEPGKNGHVKVDFDTKARDIRGTFVIDRAVSAILGANGAQRAIEFKPGQEIQFFRSHRFTEAELRTQFEDAGLRIVETRIDPVTKYIVVVAKPQP